MMRVLVALGACSCACGMAMSPRQLVNKLAGDAPATAGVVKSTGNNELAVEGPTFTKSLAAPDPIPVAGQLRAVELMSSGALFRYTPGVLSEVSLAEQDLVDYTGFRYVTGFNSCGAALFVALKTVGVQPGDKVICNAFSFTAVPSAVHHACATPVYVEATDGLVMDMADLEKKIAANPDARVLMLTHMRGKVADMARVYELAEAHGLTVVEDCAHALGIQWEGTQLGRSARVACFSSQSAKVINSGEGGFFCTDDEEIAARAICMAGSYESLIAQHLVAPSRAVFDAVKKETPNYSLRMSDLTAACVRPQIADLEERVARYNERYARIVSQLSGTKYFDIPEQDPRVRPVCDSLQIHLRNLSAEQVDGFLDAAKRRGMPVGLFGSGDNARNFRNWQYSPIATGCDATERMIATAIDVRLPAVFEEADLDQMAAVLLAALDDVVGEQA